MGFIMAVSISVSLKIVCSATRCVTNICVKFTRKVSLCVKFIKRETATPVSFCEFCEVSNKLI